VSNSMNQTPRARSNDAEVESSDARFIRRRRLLKGAAAGMPVALTLSSRSVLAAPGTCTTTSAWGSSQLVTTQSVAAHHHGFADTIWTIAEWNTNTTTSLGTPWTVLFNAVGSGLGFATAQSMRNNYNITQLFGTFVPNWSVGGTVKVKDVLAGTVGTLFQRYIVAAKLNLVLTSTTGVGSCATSDMLQDMGDGSYTPPNGDGTPWNSTMIQNYLINNNLAA
jgi:hypothetical protein